jgi:5-methyltetrahydropteroyltriglutamate--homocysteine methyltransferase
LSYRDSGPVNDDLSLLKEAAAAAKAPSAFMTAASPGVIAMFASETSHYATEDDYVFALAEAMRPEYEAIVKAGITLQIDCPDLTLVKRMIYEGREADPLRIAARNIEAVNHAIGGLPTDRVRLHLCWGNYAGPHTDDLPVAELFPLLCRTKARALSFEAANPRHEHEWEDWKSSGLPEDMILIPGVIDSVTNFVEHPRLVAQRLQRFADAVGAERVIAGADCGFGTFGAATPTVFPSIVWEKLRALAEGAALVH